MKRLISLLLSSIVLLTSLNITISSVYAASTDDSINDNQRFEKMELLIGQMLQEDGPENGSLWNMESTTAFKWSYINGCMVSAMMQLYDIKGDEGYKTFADNYMSPFISTTNNSTRGYIAATNFKISNYTLDDLNSGKALIELIASGSANSVKYTNAVSNTLYTGVLKGMLSSKVTAEGNLWHKNSYPYQVWLDGIYMETPFWLEYELEIGNDAQSFVTAADHVTNQIENVYNKLRNSTTGLYYHGYDSRADIASGDYNPSSAMNWAETDTGHSANYWLRGTGWYAMALVDDIEFMQKAEQKFNIDLSAQKNSLINIYTDLMNTMLEYQDENTGLWYQVIDHPGEEYNYIETSGSAAMSYSLMKGYNIGIADINFYNSGLEVFRNICDNKLVYADSSQSTVNLNDICQTAGLGSTSSSATIGPKHTSRDGSYEYYVSEKTVTNDAKGVAPLIFAYCQILKYNKGDEPETETTTVNAELTTETTTSAETTTKAENTTETTTSYVSHVGETLGGGSGETYKLAPTDFSSGSKTADETTENGIFTIKATSGKDVNVASSYIDLKGIGNTTQRSIAVNITGPATLTVKFFNNSSSSRTLAVENSDSSYSQTGEATASGSASNVNTLVCDITKADTYYVFSKGSGIKVTEITVTYPSGDSILIGDVDLNGTINSADAALLLRHISNTVTLTDEKQLTAGDCNIDDNHNILDVIAILKYIS